MDKFRGIFCLGFFFFVVSFMLINPVSSAQTAKNLNFSVLESLSSGKFCREY